MIYEYVGLPGSGKTYLAEKKHKENNTKLLNPTGRVRSFVWTFLYVIIHPLNFFRLFAILLKETKGVEKGLLKHKLLFLLPQSLGVEAKSWFYKEAVIDGGILQFLFSIFERLVSIDDLLKIKKILPPSRNRTVFYIETSRDAREKRMNKRRRKVREKFTSDYRENWFATINSNAKKIKEFLRKNYEFIEIDNN